MVVVPSPLKVARGSIQVAVWQRPRVGRDQIWSNGSIDVGDDILQRQRDQIQCLDAPGPSWRRSSIYPGLVLTAGMAHFADEGRGVQVALQVKGQKLLQDGFHLQAGDGGHPGAGGFGIRAAQQMAQKF